MCGGRVSAPHLSLSLTACQELDEVSPAGPTAYTRSSKSCSVLVGSLVVGAPQIQFIRQLSGVTTEELAQGVCADVGIDGRDADPGTDGTERSGIVRVRDTGVDAE